MAIQYVISEEEMNSLFDRLKLETMSDMNVWKEKQGRPLTVAEMHRAFHYVCVSWAQAMGFKGHRG